MNKNEGICLRSHFVNKMKEGGELGWMVLDYNGSTGYHWQFYPDNSGVYELVEEVNLHPSADAVGVPGKFVWKFKAVREGRGSATFKYLSPGGEKPSQEIIVEIEVS